MKPSRRTFISTTALLATVLSGAAHAQYGGRPRERGETGSNRGFHPGDANPRGAAQSLTDPAAALERELPSLRIDLKLVAEQSALFDSFERGVRDAAEAGRVRVRH